MLRGKGIISPSIIVPIRGDDVVVYIFRPIGLSAQSLISVGELLRPARCKGPFTTGIAGAIKALLGVRDTGWTLPSGA